MARRHRLGWYLFLASALVFAGAGVAAGDPLTVVASGIFAAGCVAFLVGE